MKRTTNQNGNRNGNGKEWGDGYRKGVRSPGAITFRELQAVHAHYFLKYHSFNPKGLTPVEAETIRKKVVELYPELEEVIPDAITIKRIIGGAFENKMEPIRAKNRKRRFRQFLGLDR
jgi:hypothetical protein